MIAIKVKNLSKVYKIYDKPIDRLKESINPFRKGYHKEFYALNDISFEIEKGQTFGILGRNGSGKSTLLKILTGVLTPSQGYVNTDGKISALLELGAGFNPDLSGLENIYLNGTIMGYSRQDMDKKMDSILDFAEIGDFIYQPVKMYSSGMFVRLAFSVATNIDPDILIVDEALAVGDLQFQLKCIDKMKSFKKQGKTILFVSHDVYTVRNFCDQAIWLMNGEIHQIGDVNYVVENYEDYMKIGFDNNGKPVSGETKKDILSIDKVYFTDTNGAEKEEFAFGESPKVVVDYTLHSKMEGIVGGISLYDKQNNYICGLNTKLDNQKLPSKPGKYQLILSYVEFKLLSGTYYVDVGFFESSAVITLDYKNKVNSFRVLTGDYFAEGLTLIEHQWQCKG